MKRTLLVAVATALISAPGCSAPAEFAPREPAAAGVRWLLAHQTPAGGWGPHGATALATQALERFGQTDAAIRGRAWLGAVPPPRDPFAAAARVRLFESATASLRALETSQRGDGRWSSPGFPDALMTAFALATLERTGSRVDSELLQRGRAWLLEQPVSKAWILSAVAEPAREASRQVRAAQAGGVLDPAQPVSTHCLEQLGLDPAEASTLATAHRLDEAWPERALLRALTPIARLTDAELLGLLLMDDALQGAVAPRRRAWRSGVGRLLRARQHVDGTWGGTALGTAAALIVLSQ